MLLKTIIAALLFSVASFASSAEEIIIPVVSPYSGDLKVYGEMIENAAILKAEHINAAGGIDGKMVKIVLEDDEGKEQTTVTIANKLTQDPRVSVVVGHLTSSACLAASPIYKDAKLCAISPTATNPKLAVGSPYYFRNVFTDAFQGSFLAQYAANKGLKKIAILHQVNDYSIALKDAFIAEAEKLGLTIVGVESYQAQATDFKPQLTKFKLRRPDVLFVPGYAPEGKTIAVQAKDLGVPMLGGDGLESDIMLEIPESEGLTVTTPFFAAKASPEAKAFIESFHAKYGKNPDYMAVNTYDAVGMAAMAAAKAHGDREAVRSFLASITSPETAYAGIAGPTYFDEHGDCLKPAFIKTVQGGKWVAGE